MRIGRFIATSCAIVFSWSAPALAQVDPSSSPPSAAAALPAPVRAYVDSALAIMEAHVLGGDTVDWGAFRDTVAAWAAGARVPEDALPALGAALRRLNPHSFLRLSPVQLMRLAQREAERTAGEGADRAGRDADEPAGPARRASSRPPVLSPFSDRDTPQGELHEHEGVRIGRVAIPAFGGDHSTAFADSIEALVRALDAQGACGWIVDLRGNGGGNMWPMLAGIGPVLGAGVVGHFQGADGEITGAWLYRNGVAGIDDPGPGLRPIARVSAAPTPYRIAGTPPVAVLFDGGTMSSGEAVAIAFIGRANTRSFGVRSYGFTTANQRFLLSDSTTMILTTGVDADRNRVAYPTALEPDEVVPIAQGDAIPAEPPARDPQLDAALDWLAGQSGCAGDASRGGR